MDFEEYRQRGKEVVDYIADYLENIRDRKVLPSVKPGFLAELIPENPPFEGEPWENIWDDVERVIMPGITHWQSPRMHAYFPALNSFPSLLGDMLADGLNCLGFTWAASPVVTELETIIMNWLGKMIGLPEAFLHLKHDSPGGGVIQTTASESTLVCLLAGRTEAISRFQIDFPELESAEINSRLVAYCSDQAHSSVAKAGLIGLVKMRFVETDENYSLRGDKLKEAIAKDRQNELIPFFLCATLGTTGCCSFDNLLELGPICQKEHIWLHVDAAYAGTSFLCPEYRYWLTGIEYADSLAFNPSKWMMVHFDCTAMCRDGASKGFWFSETFAVSPINIIAIIVLITIATVYINKDSNVIQLKDSILLALVVLQAVLFSNLKKLPSLKKTASRDLISGFRCRFRVKNSQSLLRTFNVDPLYLHHENSGLAIDYMNWQIPLSKRFRALKLWFVIRKFGVSGLQKHVRESVRLAKKFEEMVLMDSRFEIPVARNLGLVVFRLRGENDLTEKLLKKLNAKGNLHCVPASLKGKYVIRFTVTSQRTTIEDLNKDWIEIRTTASEILGIEKAKLNAEFEKDEFLNKYSNLFSQIRFVPKDSPVLKRRVRGMLTAGKKFSLDSRIDLVNMGTQTMTTFKPLLDTIRDDVKPINEESDILPDQKSTAQTKSDEQNAKKI